MAINFVFTHELTDLPDTTRIDTVFFQTKLGLYGIRERATGTELVPSGTALAEVSAGVFSVDMESFTGLPGYFPAYDPSLEYEYGLLVNQTDGDRFWVNGIIAPQQPRGAPTAMADWALRMGEMASLVGSMVGDPNLERYTSDEVIDEINNAMVDFAVETRLISDTIVVQVITDQVVYDINSLIEAVGGRQLAMPYRILFDGEERPAVLPTSQQNLDLYGYADFASEPYRWYVDTLDWGKVKVWGTPDADGEVPPDETGNLAVTYYALPTREMNPLAYPDTLLPPTAHMAFAYGAVRNLLMCEADMKMVEKSLFWHAEYMREKSKAMRDFQRGLTQMDSMRPV